VHVRKRKLHKGKKQKGGALVLLAKRKNAWLHKRSCFLLVATEQLNYS